MNIINIEHIHKIFGEKIIFQDASFGIQEGDKIGIVGINGTGKTSLLRMVAGLDEPDSGQIIRQITAHRLPSPESSISGTFHCPLLFFRWKQ